MKFFKKIRLLILFSIIALSFSVSAQNFSEVSNALKIGNATALSKHFDGNVEVTILKKSSNYSKSQAEMVIKNFFNTNRPSGYKAIHNGNSGGGAKYQIGELSSGNKKYRTYVFGKPNGGKLLIQEFRIEEN